jgi:sodium/proline symporter
MWSRGIDLGEVLAAADPARASLTGGRVGWAAAAAVVGGLSWGLGYLGQPHVIIRYMSIRSPGAVRQGRWIALIWALLGFSGAFLIGLFGLALHPAGIGGDPEGLMPLMATELLPAWLAGIFISGAVAAMMSTADSQLLVTTSAVSEDVVHRILRPGLDHRRMVRISRLTALLVGIAAYVLALTSEELIYGMVSYAWAGLGAAFGPAIVLSLYWRRTTGAGVLAGMVTGALATVLWSNLPLDRHLSVRLVAFLLATGAVWAGSLFTAPPPAGSPAEEDGPSA